MQEYPFQIKGQHLQLHPLRAIYWEEQKCLLLADLHLGKAQHFRRSGIPLPETAGDANWDKLIHLLLTYQPERVLLLGDLFHSAYNPVWEEFGQLVQQFQSVQFELVVGNHDVLSDHQYERFGIVCHPEPYEVSPFLLSHHPMEDIPAGKYNLAGHIHPGGSSPGWRKAKSAATLLLVGTPTGTPASFWCSYRPGLGKAREWGSGFCGGGR